MMDLSFSPRPQSLLSFPSSQFQLPSSIRRELLGFGPHLRPPSLRSRRRCRRPVSQNPPPRSAFHESQFEDSVVAVAAAALAAFAALQVMHLSFSRRRPGASEVSELRKDEAVWSQFLGDKSIEAESFLNEASDISGETVGYTLPEEVYPSDFKDAQPVKLQKDVMVHADDKIQPDYGFSSVGHGKSFSKIPTIQILNSSSVMVHTVDMKQDNSSVLMPELQPGECKEPVAVSSLPEVEIKQNVGSFAVPAKKIERIQTEDNEVKHATDEGVELLFSGHDRLHRQFDEVTSYKVDKKPEVMSISCSKSLNVEPRQLNRQDKNDSYARLRRSLKVSNALATGSHLSAEFLERQGPRASFKKGPKSQEKDLVKDNEIGDMQKNLIHKNGNGNLSGLTRQNGKLNKEDYDLLGYLQTYNRMLKDTRLKDCVGLLESMKKKGLLDMDKVHHMTFLKACKSQKAVREAFQFSKLIKKPTLSTYNSLLSVCASSQDFDGAFQVMLLVKEAGLKPDCKLYTTLISTCAKCGKVDAMFEVFHEMVSAGVEPNVNTYGALIDGCARAGQVAKAFGAYGIMRSKKVQPDRVVFNALITACGQSRAVDRAFDVLAEMRGEARPIDPDHVTVGALMRTCAQVGQVDRVREVYQMLNLYNIKGTPEVYTIAVRSCSQNGDLDFALSIYDDMKSNAVLPDEMFLSTIIDVAGHAGKIEVAFDILKDANHKGIHLGHVSYSSLMGACCNAKQWKKALELYEDIKAIKLVPTIPMLNALITSLCDGDQLLKSVEVLDEMIEAGVRPTDVTYSILIVACERKGEAELGLAFLAQAKRNMVLPNLIMCRCLTGLCLQSFEKAHELGETVVSFNSGKPQIDNKWTSDAIMVYRQTIAAGVIPTIEVFSQVLGCLKFPRDSSLRDTFIENLGVSFDSAKTSNISSLLDGFGEYDTRCFSILEEAATLGVVSRVSIEDSPIFVDARKLNIHTVEVYLLMILKGLKHRLAAGARLPNITISLPIERAKVELPKGERAINLVGRVGQAVGSLLRRLGLPYQGNESYGKIRINGLTLRRWFKPKLTNSPSAPGGTMDMILTPARLAKGISDQQRSIRSNSLSLE